MTLTGWVARHTGMPSLRTDQAGPIMAGDRLVAVAPRGGTIVSDPQAPIGRPVTYRQGIARATLTRASMGSHLITDTSGHTIVPVRIIGDDQEQTDTGAVMLTTSIGCVTRWPKTRPPLAWTVEALTRQPHTDGLRGLLATSSPVLLLHDATMCQVHGCDILPVRHGVVGTATMRRTGRIDVATREWSLSLVEHSPALTGHDMGTSSPVVTWGEWDAHDHHWAHRTYSELCRLIAGMPS